MIPSLQGRAGRMHPARRRKRLFERLTQHVEIGAHDVEVGDTGLNIVRRYGLKGVEGRDGQICLAGAGSDGLRDGMVSAFKHQHHGKVQLVHLLRKKGDGLEAGLRFCRAAGKCGVVFQTVILRQVAEGETVGKEQGVARSVVCNGLCWASKRSSCAR